MNLTQNYPLKSVGLLLDTSEEAFGELRDSSLLRDDMDALRSRIEEDGYLFIRGFFKRDDVLAARRDIVEKLAAEGFLQGGTDPMEAIAAEEASAKSFRPDLTTKNKPLQRLLYSGAAMEFHADFFGETIRHYDFTWLRTIGRGTGTRPHCDMVYIGTGRAEKIANGVGSTGRRPDVVGRPHGFRGIQSQA